MRQEPQLDRQNFMIIAFSKERHTVMFVKEVFHSQVLKRPKSQSEEQMFVQCLYLFTCLVHTLRKGALSMTRITDDP